MLRRDDAWIWDSWVVDDGELYHLFFLSAPRSLGDPERRHLDASIGHATSPDLVDWTDHGTALAPSAHGWDDLSLWTGSVIRRPDGGWAMFYTALGSGGRGADDQRIGLAHSDDLFTWHRVGDAPVVTADARWYRTQPGDLHASATWRDPFVVADGAGFRMLVTARAVLGRPGDDGVLAQATSRDLVHWEVGPPVSAPGAGFGQLEVAHVHEVDGRPVLTFTCHPDEQTAARRARHGRFCTWAVVGEPGASLAGPWDVGTAQPFTADPALFAAPLVQRRDGSWALLGFRALDPADRVDDDGLRVGDPVPVAVVDGAIVATESSGAEKAFVAGDSPGMSRHENASRATRCGTRGARST